MRRTARYASTICSRMVTHEIEAKTGDLVVAAQTFSESIISLAIMRCSLAVFSQQVEVSTAPVVGLRRW